MHSSIHARALLPLIALQGAIGTLGGFIGFFVISNYDMHAMFSFTAWMLTAAMLATLLAYAFGARLGLDGKRMLQLGFLLPGLLILFGDQSTLTLAIAYGSFNGLTWGARHWLEMSLIKDGERDRYAAHCASLTVILGIITTLGATILLAKFSEQSEYVYRLYGVLCVAGALLLGNRIPRTKPVSISNPVSVVKQPEFIACLPLFFLESGLFGITHALSSAGAVNALGSASHFGWVATVAGLAGGVALHLTRQKRDIDNRANWLGASCLVVGFSFVLLGASAWLPVLYIGHQIFKALGTPFLSASEQVLNQRTLDIRGQLSDRVVAREFVLWLLRMISLLLFWALANVLSPLQLLATGSALLALATGMEYLIGQNWFWSQSKVIKQPA